MDYLTAADKCILDIHKLDELRRDAYENAIIYKERTKPWHDKKIARREFNVGGPVLLFNSRLHIFPGKSRSRWSGPFEVTKVMQSGVVKIRNQSSRSFIINGQRSKHYDDNNNIPTYYPRHTLAESPLIAPTT